MLLAAKKGIWLVINLPQKDGKNAHKCKSAKKAYNVA